MGMKIRGVGPAVTNLGRVGTQMFQRQVGALVQEAETIMARSKEEFVPVRDGALRASGHVSAPEILDGRVKVTLSYGGVAAPYALSVHENPRSGKTEGVSPSGKKYKTWAKVGQWKYLEQPVLEAVPGLAQRLGARARMGGDARR